ncbi:unnamed protein product [Leptidea sinapis]|uniref:C-mannosyltransferase DPY19L1 n=1 Tax=Leptidea sinapis TaxID=189913 RepID=A0A5E4R1T3_9NEOP|nr:unnamed protein product [Leptidea sinapis]
MSLRTESGFYYSYYKTVVEETPFVAGISKLMYDKTVEYPKEVNAFNRFNIHPEVIVGALYRYVMPWLNTTEHVQCHMVDRGAGFTPVQSCVGVGVPIFFYLEAIWVMAGLNVAALFLHAMDLSESFMGGFLAVMQYFSNHAECTRVQWTPNARENWAAPLLMLQSWLLSIQLQDVKRKNYIPLQVAIFILNCLCLLSWQFTQFIFLVQIAIFFIMEQLRIISTFNLSVFLHSHYCGLHMAILLLQGNDMLKSSLYASLFVVVSLYCMFFSGFRVKIKSRLDLIEEIFWVILRIFVVGIASIYLKKFICDFLELEEDGHIWDILVSKFTDYKNFHTLMYTCSEVFDFLPFRSIKNMTNSFLIPYVVFGVISAFYYWFVSLSCAEDLDKPKLKEQEVEDEDSGIENTTENKPRKGDLDVIDKEIRAKLEERDAFVESVKSINIEAAIFFNISLLVVYGVMAALVMRLKLLFSTQLCVISSLVFKKKYYVYPRNVNRLIIFILILGVFPMLWSLVNNMYEEISHIDEFSDYSQEELLQWIMRQPIGAYAGSMPVLASVMLSTRRPIVAHPHYEHLEARQRAYTVYKVYGRFTAEELYQEMNKLRVSYLIVERNYCYGKSDRGCKFSDIWDVETGDSMRERPPLCHILLTESVDHFYPVFMNAQYSVFRIHDISVRGISVNAQLIPVNLIDAFINSVII